MVSIASWLVQFSMYSAVILELKAKTIRKVFMISSRERDENNIIGYKTATIVIGFSNKHVVKYCF
jgi:hypothetical protein